MHIMKTLSIVVPAYNSENYLSKCLDPLVIGGDEVEVIIVNDGSTDNTEEIAKEYCQKYSNIVRLENKPNGGHGSAINRGLSVAKGLYFKVVDSDDWFEEGAYRKLIKLLKKQVSKPKPIDLVLANYVYEYSYNNTRHTINYRKVIPRGRTFSWDEVGTFKPGQYLLMHSMVYRTQVLRDSKLVLPEHTFYVDNLVAYIPLPYVETIYYLDVDLYRYFIGRADQSVNRVNMIKRISQQIRVNEIMVESYHLYSDIDNHFLRKYMLHYLEVITLISVVHIRLANKQVEDLWSFIEKFDIKMHQALRNSELTHVIMGVVRLPGKLGKLILLAGYELGRKLYKFS